MSNNKKNRPLLISFATIIVFVIFWRLADNVKYLFPFLISVINTVLIIWFLFKKEFHKLILLIYFFYNILTLKFPLIYLLIVYKTDYLDGYYLGRGVTIDDLLFTNLYILFFDMLLIIFLYVFKFSKKRKKIIFIENHAPFQNHTYAIIFILLAFSYLAKIYLMSIGVWFFFEMNDIDISNYPLIGIADNIEKLDFLILMYFVFKYRMKSLSKKDIIIVVLTLIISLFFAYLSTSKGKLLILLFPLILFIAYSPRPIKGLLIILPSLLFINTFFKIMLYARENSDSNLSEIIKYYDYDEIKYNNFEFIEKNEKMITRLEYQTVISKVINRFNSVHGNLEFGYFQNLIGLVPRIIWSNKPDLGIDANRMGYEIGLLSRSDDYTTVGVTPLGISYYLYGVYGLIFLAPFTAFLLTVNIRLFDERYWVGFLISILVAVQLARNGTYLNIIPSLVQIYIIFSIFGAVLNNKNFQRALSK